MKITVSVKGRFHAFYLAEQMQKYDNLNQLITSYPKFEAIKYGVSDKNINSILVHEIIERIFRKAPGALKKNIDIQYLLRELYDKNAAKKINSNSDIFIGWSSNCLHSLRKAQEKGMYTIVERGSSHILHQDSILEEEYRLNGINYNNISKKIIKKEIKEYNEADFISVPSSYVKRTFLEQGVDENKIIQVPYGVNLSNFHPIKKEDNVFRIIFCGALSIRKGIRYLLQAFKELQLPNSELWLIGSIQEEVKPILSKYKSDNIVYKGTFPETKLFEYYSQGSVFCLPSIEEGLAMVQVQALACGLPLICTTNTGGEDLINEGEEGYVVPIRNVEKLKEKILLLYEDEELRSFMSNNALNKIKNNYTWDNYGLNLLKHYENLVLSEKA